MPEHLILFGATGGIATALRERLAREGWTLTLVTRRPEHLPDMPAHCAVVEADSTTESGVRHAFEQAESTYGPPTAAVNTLGNVLLKPLHHTTGVEFTDILRLHLFSSYAILKESVARMDTGGRIVFISSAAARTGLPNHELIAMAKGAVEGLVRSAAATYAPKGLRVNAVASGLTETPATAPLCKGKAREASERLHPLGRIGKPEDVASALAWLIDPAQSWVTGQILNVDGGLAHLRTHPSGRTA